MNEVQKEKNLKKNRSLENFTDKLHMCLLNICLIIKYFNNCHQQ